MRQLRILVMAVFVFQISLFAFNFDDLKKIQLGKWDDPNAYKPYPVLFLHGFAKGSSESWNPVPGESLAVQRLKATYIEKYSVSFPRMVSGNPLSSREGMRL